MGTTSKSINYALKVSQNAQHRVDNADIGELHTAFMHVTASDAEAIRDSITSGDFYRAGTRVSVMLNRYFMKLEIDEMRKKEEKR